MAGHGFDRGGASLLIEEAQMVWKRPTLCSSEKPPGRRL